MYRCCYGIVYSIGLAAKGRTIGDKQMWDSKQLKQVAIAVAMGSQFLGSSVAGAILGVWLDQQFNSSPIGMVVCGLLGVVSGVILLLRIQKRLQ